MLWCENCGKEYDEKRRVVCPICGGPLCEIRPEEMEAKQGDWNLKGDQAAPPWPKNAAGQPEKAVLLTRMSDIGSEAELTISMLRAFGVPVTRRYAGDGQLGRVILGFSGFGTELYVPESMLSLAQDLMKPNEAD